MAQHPRPEPLRCQQCLATYLSTMSRDSAQRYSLFTDAPVLAVALLLALAADLVHVEERGDEQEAHHGHRDERRPAVLARIDQLLGENHCDLLRDPVRGPARGPRAC